MDDKQQEQKSSDKTTKRIRLIARILSTFFTAYAILMMIGYLISWMTTGTADPYAVEDYPFIENLPPILMFLAIVGLAIAWRYEKIGGIINLSFSCLAIVVLLMYKPITLEAQFIVPLVLLLIIALPGILFLMAWRRSQEIKTETLYNK
ncbi:MAG: hypothetical protein ACNFW9_03575 [Candidatus Kerfeldbacteria bacterium]|jgi:hypothetical protein